MDYELENFNILCESILNQKKHGFLHNLRPFARKYRYIEQDFLDIWYKSGFKKLQYALDGANFKFDFTQIQVPNGQRDIYEGTDRPGVFLRYKIAQKDQKYVLTELLKRLKQNSEKDDLAQWRTYLQNELQSTDKNKQKFHLNMQLQVIARIIPKSGQSFQNKKAEQVTQYNSAGFKGNIYIWFDLQKYKNEISSKLAQQEALSKDLTYNGQIFQQTQSQQDDEEDQLANIHLTKKEYDKICIANFEMNIKDSEKEGLLGLASHLVTGDIGDVIGTKVTTGFNRLRGVGKQKDTSEDPDFIRKKYTLFNVGKPFIQVISTVTLKNWLYNAEEDPERKYMGVNDKKTNESSLSKYPFQLRKIKESANPNSDFDLNTSPCWCIGSNPYNKWNNYHITKKWLQDKNIDSHEITFRFQAWIKNEDGYYFEYRFVLNLNDYYHKQQKLEDLRVALDTLERNDAYKNAKPEQWTNKIKELKQAIHKIESGSFKQWLYEYIQKMKEYHPDPSMKVQIDKMVFNSKNKLVNRDNHIRGSLQSLLQRDYAAGRFFEDFLTKLHYKDLKVQGESLESVMNSIEF